MDKPVNQRKETRAPLVEMVTVISSSGKSFISHSENLSTSGIFVVLDDPLPVGEHGLLSVIFDGQSRKQEIHYKFEVTHTHSTCNGSIGMGLRFLDLTEGEKQLLKALQDRPVQ